MSRSCSLESIAKTNSNTETDEKTSSFAKAYVYQLSSYHSHKENYVNKLLSLANAQQLHLKD